MAELESLIRLPVPLAQGYLLGRPAEPWAALPDGLAGAIRDRHRQDVRGQRGRLTVDAPAVRAGDAVAAAADRFDPLVCVDDRGHYLGVLRIEQLVHRLLAGPRL